jgi:hypothetical protein
MIKETVLYRIIKTDWHDEPDNSELKFISMKMLHEYAEANFFTSYEVITTTVYSIQ